MLLKPRPTAEAFRSPELAGKLLYPMNTERCGLNQGVADDDNWDNDFATTISPGALHLPHIKGQDNFGGLLSSDRLKAFASIDGARDDSENWDSTFDGELVTIKGLGHWAEPDPQEQTIRPLPRKSEKTAESKAPQSHRRQKSSKTSTSSSAPQAKSPVKAQFSSKFELPPRRDLLFREQSTEDYSDLFDDNDNVFSRGLKSAGKDAPQLFHPSDLTSLPRSTQSPVVGSMRRPASSRRPSVLPDQPMRRSRSTVEITQFAEGEDDEDFSDIFGGDAVAESEESDRGSEDGQGQLMLLSKLSNSSWLGDDEDEDDPFAMMDPGWNEMDLEANIARDRHARLAEKVEELVRSMKTTEGEDILSELAEDLLNLTFESPEVKNMIISAHGLLPILEILEPCTVKSRQHMILQLLKIVNAVSTYLSLAQRVHSFFRWSLVLTIRSDYFG